MVRFSDFSFAYFEDDPLSREVMQIIMQDAMGVESLLLVETSEDAVGRLRALDSTPDVVLLDIHIRPLDGFAVLDALRADTHLQRIKVIAVTASVMTDEVDRLRDAGFDGAIAKPISVMSFPSLIERVLDGESVWHIL
jgi:two-component system cell cycle response regulator DivK